MVKTIAFQTQVFFVTSDSLRLSLNLQLNNQPLDSATDVKAAVLGVKGSGSSQTKTLVIPSTQANYDATTAKWIVDFTADQINGFLKTPTDSTSALAYTSAVVEVQATGIGTLLSKEMSVIKGYIT